MCLSCRYIWRGIPVASNAQIDQRTHFLKKKKHWLWTRQHKSHERKCDLYDNETNGSFSFLRVSVFLGHAWTYDLRVFLLRFWTTRPGPQEIGSVIVYVCGEKPNHSLFGCCTLAHISLTPQNQNRGAQCFSSAWLCCRTKTGHSGAAGTSYGPSSSPGTTGPCENKNKFLKQTGFSYLVWLMVLQATQPCASSGLIQKADLQKQGLIYIKGLAEANCQNTLASLEHFFS